MKLKNNKVLTALLCALMTLGISGCGGGDDETQTAQLDNQDSEIQEAAVQSGDQYLDLAVIFGYEGESFILKLEENPTAAQIAKDVGTVEWNLPIIHFDDFEEHEVMQYYDIPSSYDIPSNPETVTTEQLGDVYYSHPNRIIIFYQDAKVSGEYTKVGHIENTENLNQAVVSNPVLEGWNTKIVTISLAE